MELSTSLGPASLRPPPGQQSPPPARPDLRPTADAAALARDPQPDLALGAATASSQTGAVSQALVGSAPLDRRQGTELPEPQAVMRLLKPYGIAMFE